MAVAKKEVNIVIKKLEIESVPLKIVGDSPLIVHAWSEKAKKQMLATQQKIKTQKEIRNPFDEFINSMYWLTEKPESTEKAFADAIKNGAKWGFPTTAIKQSTISSAYRKGYVKNQTGLRGCIFLKSAYGDLAEIKGSIPRMREDMVTIGMGTADLRYRAEYPEWYMELVLEYDKNDAFRLEDIINFIDYGGYCNGIGEWRPEKDGMFGQYHVEI